MQHVGAINPIEFLFEIVKAGNRPGALALSAP